MSTIENAMIVDEGLGLTFLSICKLAPDVDCTMCSQDSKGTTGGHQ